jgi:hypothetical protein
MGAACNALRAFFSKRGFTEVVLNPIDYNVTTHPDAWPAVEGRQPRFNTEPEIWSAWNGSDPFYSITPLFRTEPIYNLLHRAAFQIVDFFLPISVDELLPIFKSIISHLTQENILHCLDELAFERVRFDVSTDLPDTADLGRRFLIATGFGPQESFFEIDATGASTRKEIFLACEKGVLELATLGVAGYNHNSLYGLEFEALSQQPPLGLSGIGFGLERLLLADRLLGG